MNHPQQPILTQADADEARWIASDVAARLSDDQVLQSAARVIVEQSIFPEVACWLPHSVSRGNAGLAVLFAYVDDCFPNQGWDCVGRHHLEIAARSLESQRVQSVSLFGGLTGVAFAAWCLSRNGKRYRGLAAALDETLFPQAALLAAKVKNATDGIAVHDYDVISGLSGVGAYLLCRRDFPKARKALENVLRSLVVLSREREHAGRPRWHTPATLMFDEVLMRRYPGGLLNCGVAHGIPGPLMLLSLAEIQGIDIDGQIEAIERLADWLARNRADDAWGINWPGVFALNEADAPSPGRSAWCYGGPGVARALWLAGKAINRPRYCDLAVAAMKAAVMKPRETRGIPSPTFCHGVAGLLQITLRFAGDTALPVFHRAAQELTAELIAAYEPESLLGYRSNDSGHARGDNPGLLDGAPGVALALLTACGVEPVWDRLFLLS